MSEELSMLDLLLLILKKQDELEARLEKVEATAHPQSVMADPILTEAIKNLLEKTSEPIEEREFVVGPLPNIITPTVPWNPSRIPLDTYPKITFCSVVKPGLKIC